MIMFIAHLKSYFLCFVYKIIDRSEEICNKDILEALNAFSESVDQRFDEMKADVNTAYEHLNCLVGEVRGLNERLDRTNKHLATLKKQTLEDIRA